MKIITDRAEALKLLNRKRSKYGVKTDAQGKAERTVDGFIFDSLKEANRYRELALLARAFEIRDLEVHVNYPLIVKEQVICIYEADFTYTDKSGHRIVEDVKSPATRRLASYRIKSKLLKALTGIIITEV